MQSWARWSKDISSEQRGTLGTFTHSQWQLWCTGSLIVYKWSDESIRVRSQIASNCVLGAGSCPESPAGHVIEQVKEIAQFSPTLTKPASLTGTYPSSICWGTTETWGISVYWHPHDCFKFCLVLCDTKCLGALATKPVVPTLLQLALGSQGFLWSSRALRWSCDKSDVMGAASVTKFGSLFLYKVHLWKCSSPLLPDKCR